eukprot:3857838-Pyramimonas_sp.AAC.1
MPHGGHARGIPLIAARRPVSRPRHGSSDAGYLLECVNKSRLSLTSMCGKAAGDMAALAAF